MSVGSLKAALNKYHISSKDCVERRYEISVLCATGVGVGTEKGGVQFLLRNMTLRLSGGDEGRRDRKNIYRRRKRGMSRNNKHVMSCSEQNTYFVPGALVHIVRQCRTSVECMLTQETSRPTTLESPSHTHSSWIIGWLHSDRHGVLYLKCSHKMQ